MKLESAPNDYCPCGSGKKYKKCCMLKQGPANPLSKELLDAATKRAAQLLMKFAEKNSIRPEKEALSEKVPIMPNSESRDTLFNSLLSPWFFYLWYPLEAPDDELMPSDQSVAARFINEEGDRLDGVTRRYIEAARREPFSFWQVLA